MFQSPNQSLREALQAQHDGYVAMGWTPNLFDQFVLRNGHAGIAQRRPKGVRKMAYGACFRNSIKALWDDRFPGYGYVEGKAASAMGFIVHHAWLEDADGNVIDLTWKDPHLCSYYGVRFDRETVDRECFRTGMYGLLMPAEMCNLDLMKQVDPGIEDILRAA